MYPNLPGTQDTEDSEPPPTGVAMETDDAMETDVDPETARKLEMIQKQDLIVQYLRDCVTFTEQMHRVIVLVSQLLASKSASDVLESVDFLGQFFCLYCFCFIHLSFNHLKEINSLR